jgi:hypothetical protein
MTAHSQSAIRMTRLDQENLTMLARPHAIPHLLLSLAVAALLAGCGPASESLPEVKDLGAGAQALADDNGLSVNGLNMNGLNKNGLNKNGLNKNGLATTDFGTWFNEDAAWSNTVMKYVYGCAAPSGSTLNWTNPTTGVSYSWAGVFGLAPGWTGGTPATVAEQQVMTACLAAHVNKFGRSVMIAVEGRTANGTKIPVGPNELATFNQTEAAFFGNLFTGEGAFVCLDHGDFVNYSAKSSIRACAFNKQSVGPSAVCAPLYFAGNDCNAFCQRNPSMPFYDNCTYNGVTYQPLTTRFQKADIYTCGDGVCQLTEKCGTGLTPDNCSDCGPCP